uniref:Plant natriuretic peptide-like 5 n=1 Tax=Venturia inaequalis TaxID=5025 RepID=A0A513ZS99_VENIN|nr:plant natriuretic peptide-like 5 [Venturia inaequalis]
MKFTTALLALSSFAHLGLCIVGVVTTYRPPYLPTKCYGSNQGQFPAGNLFGAVGPGLWDNGAACGRYYAIRCINPIYGSGHCVPGARITVKIVEGRLGSRAPLISLSMQAAQMLYTGSGSFKAEFGEVPG